jgi:hypothetical protein
MVKANHITVLARAIFLAAAFCLTCGRAYAQISPGELVSAHVSLEGIANCTKCHTLGKDLSNAKCLDCHTELRTRIDAGRGLHARQKDKPCAECHKDHHGRSFPIVRFDTKTFDHNTTGYVLEGKHRAQECAACHRQDRVRAQDVQRNAALMSGHTYLGLGTDCLSCHQDIHRGQLGNQCQSCHSIDAWKPAVKFAHEKTKYPLTGRHADVKCASCHKMMPDDGKTVKFAGLAFDKCSACHDDPHKGKFQKPCETCHSTSGWNHVIARGFDHGLTKFPLKGKHASVKCEGCHKSTRNPVTGKVTQSFAVIRFQKCADCHADVHRGEFAGRPDKGTCESCHTEKGFAPAQFVHATTRYPLKGKHENLACAKCHPAATNDPAGRRVPPNFRVKEFNECGDCHTDAHARQFVRRASKGACEECHGVEGFAPARFAVIDHQKSRFPLAGGHLAVACARCHPADKVKAKSTRLFVWTEEMRCEVCHKDPHGAQFAKSKYDGCAACHDVEAWKTLKFSHDRTAFPLVGKHIPVVCAGCHKETFVAGKETIRKYSGAPTRCIDCHPQGNVVPLGTR